MNSYPKGLVYGLQMLDSWLYDDSKPFLHIEADETFAQLKEKVGTGYFEGLVEKYLLNNPHTSIVIGVPSVGLAAKKEEELKAKLAQYKASLSDAEIEKLIFDGQRLLAYQEAEDKEEDLARIPLLEREDLRKTILPLSIREEKADGSSILYHDIFTGGIAYLTVSFDATHLSKEDYPYLSLLKYCFGVMDTENYAYEDLCRETDLYTGILTADTTVVRPVDEESPKLYFDVKTKVLYENIGKAFELIREILFTTKLEDKERLKEILSENRSRLESALISAGHVAAMGRMSSYITEAGDIAESLNGIRFLRFLQQADDHFEECAEELISSLKRVAKALLCKDRMMMSVISPKEANLPVTEEFLKVKQAAYDAESSVEPKEPFRANCLNEGFKTPGDVQYVCLGGFADPKKYPYSGALKVLKVILAYDYLWMNVRVKGGAYGCMSAFNRNGVAGFVSYRDPNLTQTYDVYQQLPDLLADILHLFPGGAVGDAQHKLDAVLMPLGVVSDGCVAQEVVGHKHQFLIKRTDAGAAERDFFYDAFHIVGGNPVADHKRPLCDNDNAAENICQGILGGQRDGHGADAQRSHKGRDIVLPFFGYHGEAQQDTQKMCQGRNHFCNRFVNSQSALFPNLNEEAVACVAHVIDTPGEANDKAGAQDVINDRMLGKEFDGTVD